MTRRERLRADFLSALGARGNAYSPIVRYTDGGAAEPFDRAARRVRNRSVRRARKANR